MRPQKNVFIRCLRLTILLLLVTPFFSWSQITVSGKVLDRENGEDLYMAYVYIPEYGLSMATNEYGFFSLQIPSDDLKNATTSLIVAFVGYKSDTLIVSTTSSSRLTIALSALSQQLQTVEISASAKSGEERLSSTQVGALHLRVADLKNIPTIGGERDIIKSAQLLPGISGGTEGTTDFFVRGGNGDQNLVLLDEATVYNVGHLFGFFSVFNSDALQDVTIYKGGFPSYYGGRLSSVMDISQKEGNLKTWEVNGGVGLISSRLMVEGPLLKDKASILIAGRRTYVDEVFSWVGVKLPYYFYDLNWKANYVLNENNRFFYSGYLGNDVLSVVEDDESDINNFDFQFGFNLGNITHSLRWNHIYNAKLFSNITLTSTNFDYDIGGKLDDNNLLVQSRITDYTLKSRFTYFKNEKSVINFGTEVIHHSFQPNVVSTSGTISEFLKNQEAEKLSFQEVAFFANDDRVLIKNRLKLNYGLRLSSALTGGSLYGGLEPRVSSSYVLNEFSSFKASYSRMKQYLHRVSSSTISLPTDLWYPVTPNVKPQSADQVSFGYFLNLDVIQSAFSAEVYYKKMNNLIEYREGTNLLLNSQFENDLVQGEGRAYGIELLLRREVGRFKGWVGYTLARSERSFEQLNQGKTFPAKYDRRHDLSLVGSYELTERISLGAVWVYASGARFTGRIGSYVVPNPSLTNVEVLPIFSSRNEMSMSPSHRFDLNITIKSKSKRRWQSEWQFGCYNLYNRATPYRVRLNLTPPANANQQQSGFSPSYDQPGLFGFIPYFTYNFNFK